MNEITALKLPSPRSQATQVEQSRAIAEVQAMVVVAQKFPRDLARVQASMREACKQMGLAQVAFFKFPRAGGTVTGPSIHLATELARCWGNVDYGIKEMSRADGEGMSEMQAWAWDLETNARAATFFLVPHVIDTKQGPKKLKETRDIYENNANNGARRVREMIFRILPAWFVEEAENICRETLLRGVSEKPMAQQVADLLEAFAALGVVRARIEAKVGTKIDAITPIDLANLRVAFRSIKNREVSIDDEFPATPPAASVAAALDQLATVEQEADSTAPAVSDAFVPPDAAVQSTAPTGAPSPDLTLPEELAHKARAIAAAIKKATTVRALDQIQLAQRATLDSIALANPAAHEWLMQASRDRVAEIGAA